MFSLFEKLEEIKKKPEHVRKHILNISTLSIFGVIFLVWLSTFNLKIDKFSQTTDGTNPDSPMGTIERMFKDVGDTIGKAKDNMHAQLEYVKSTAQATTTVTQLEKDIEAEKARTRATTTPSIGSVSPPSFSGANEANSGVHNP